MTCNSHLKTLLSATELATDPVQVPILVSGEPYIVTQQDIRRTEDVRLLTFSRRLPDGTLTSFDPSAFASSVLEAILKTFKLGAFNEMQPNQQQQQTSLECNGQHFPALTNNENGNNNVALAALTEMLSRFNGNSYQILALETFLKSLRAPYTASLEQQLQWAKAPNHGAPVFPFNYATTTSTSDLPAMTSKKPTCCCRCCRCCSAHNCPIRSTYSRGCNTSHCDCICDKDDGNVLSARAQKKQLSIQQAHNC